jgi:hypothetical protein
VNDSKRQGLLEPTGRTRARKQLNAIAYGIADDLGGVGLAFNRQHNARLNRP